MINLEECHKETTMQWPIIIVLVIVVPIIIFPVVFVWYLNIKGIRESVRAARRQQQIGEAELKREAKLRSFSTTAWQYIDTYLGFSKESSRRRR